MTPKTLYELTGIDSYGFDGPGEKEGRDRLLQEIAERDKLIEELKEQIKELQRTSIKDDWQDGY